mgnify:CR=1 FL=1
MDPSLDRIKRIEVPLVVVLGEHRAPLSNVRQWVPGSIIELTINAEEDLRVRVNNREIGTGSAVKIGENFGVRINTITGKTDRIKALGPGEEPSDGSDDGMSPDQIAEALLDGQV